MKKVVQIHPGDTVVVAVAALSPGEIIEVGERRIVVKEPVAEGHKVALQPIKQGEAVVKYGFSIGHASSAIAEGAWVHSHNCKTSLSDTLSYAYHPVVKSSPTTSGTIPTFLGYKRKNGAVGTRNEIWIINTVGCVNKTAEHIARIANEQFTQANVDGVFTFSHPYGCSQLGDDLDNTKKILSALMRNPNAGGVLLLGLGCENNRLDGMLGDTEGMDATRMRSLVAQSVEDEVETGVRLVGELFAAMKTDKRKEVPVSELVLAMKCGGSDGFSGITGNALVGRVADWLTGMNGTVILSEVPEMFGAEQLLMNRASDEKTFQRVVALINAFKQYYIDYNQPIYENPSPGNKAGGITTLEEKSLGAVQKGGEAIVTQVLQYGEQPVEHGLLLLNAPGNDGVSSTAMAASGATMILFTTGRGTPLGAPVPTVKISTNSVLYTNKPKWIDFDAGQLLNTERTQEEITHSLLQLIIDVASGRKKTQNEIHGYKEIAIWKKGVTL